MAIVSDSLCRVSTAFLGAALAGCQATATDWVRAGPADVGIDPAPLEQLVDAIDAGRYGRIDHLLILRRGQLVLERHFDRDYAALTAALEPEDRPYDYDHPNWHPYLHGGELHRLQSVTKSITSLCIVLAIDEGLIPEGVGTPAMASFGDYGPDLSDPRRRAMTLEDLLTMRSGIDWQERTPTRPTAPTTRATVASGGCRSTTPVGPCRSSGSATAGSTRS